MTKAATNRWPAGHRAAIVLSFDVDGEHGERVHHGDDDWYWRSQARYGLETGIWRLFDILADYDVGATFCWVGLAAEERPDAVRAAFDAGHEIATHGWDHRPYTGMTPAEQRADIERTRAALEQLTGERPIGHKTPFWRFSPESAAVLQELGFRWSMDVAASDLPVLAHPNPSAPPLVELSPSRLWDDYSYFVEPIMPPSHAFEMWRDDIDVLRAEGKLMCLTLHPWIIGRPGPSRALTAFLDYVIALGDVWIARADHLTYWWLQNAS